MAREWGKGCLPTLQNAIQNKCCLIKSHANIVYPFKSRTEEIRPAFVRSFNTKTAHNQKLGFKNYLFNLAVEGPECDTPKGCLENDSIFILSQTFIRPSSSDPRHTARRIPFSFTHFSNLNYWSFWNFFTWKWFARIDGDSESDSDGLASIHKICVFYVE